MTYRSDVTDFDVFVLASAATEQVRLHATLSSQLGPVLTVDQHVLQIVIHSDCPLGGLPDFLDAFLLEHLDEVLLDAVLQHLRVGVLPWARVNDLRLDSSLLLVFREELLPVS